MKHYYKHIVIDVPLDPESLKQIFSLNHSPLFLKAKKVTLLTIYNEKMSNELPSHIVDKHDFPDIENHILSLLEEVKKNLIPSDVDPLSWKTVCLFNADTKRVSVEFLQEQKADIAIVATRGEQGIEGLFKDSFTFYLVESAPCDVYVIRPVHQGLSF